MFWKRVIPIASVLAVGAIAFTLRIGSPAQAPAPIAAVGKTLVPAIQNAELKDLVTKVAPAFVAHRDAAKNVLEKGMSGM